MLLDIEILYADRSITSRANLLTDVWALDLEVTWHMTLEWDWFQSYKPIFEGYVFMEDDHALEIVILAPSSS